MLIENDKIILIFSTRSKPWAFAIDSGRGVGRLIPRCRPFAMAPAGEPSQAPSRGRFAIGSSWWAVSRSKAVAVALDSGFCRGSPDSTV